MNKNNLLAFDNIDIYSIILFIIFKIKKLPEYAALSELVYVLDKDSLLKLCEYFGGTTIKIPTIEELETLLYALTIYQLVDIEKQSYNNVIKNISEKCSDISAIKQLYIQIKDILKEYSFSGNRNEI